MRRSSHSVKITVPAYIRRSGASGICQHSHDFGHNFRAGSEYRSRGVSAGLHRVENNDAASLLARIQIGKGARRLIDGISSRDQFVELEPPATV